MNKRILQATVELDTAERNFKRVEKECLKDKQPMPAYLYNRLHGTIQLCQANLEAARVTEEAMNKYPPMARSS